MVLTLSLFWRVGFPEALEGLYHILLKEPYLASYPELVFIGILPIIFTLVCGEDFAKYGFRRDGFWRSMLYSLPPALLVAWLRGFPKRGYGLTFPWNFYYAVLNLVAYGPLEVFFVVWLIENTDEYLGSEAIPSEGSMAVPMIFGLSHVLWAIHGDLVAAVVNAFMVSLVFLYFGVIYKYTRNIAGFMTAWTLMNRQSLLSAIQCLV